MRYKKSQAFSLTELLIALVIIAVIFAAAAPIMTRKQTRKGQTVQQEPVWAYVNGSTKNYFFDSGVSSWESILAIGMNKPDIPAKNSVKPISTKVLINTIKEQNQVQLRAGTTGKSKVGFFAIDDKQNFLLGPNLIKNMHENSDTAGNTIVGYNSANMVKNIKDTTVIGSDSLSVRDGENLADMGGRTNTIIGSNTGRNLTAEAENNILLGAETGLALKNSKNNIVIGQGTASDISFTTAGNSNIIIGTKIRGALTNPNNVLIGNSTPNTSFYTSVVIGPSISDYNASYAYSQTKLENATDLTAIGYGACRTVKGDYNSKPPKTCIGYSSATADNNAGTSSSILISDNGFEHVFLGGKPNGFKGRSVIEVYNPTDSTIKPTVIFNSNLMVKGYVKDNNGTISYSEGTEKYTYCSGVSTKNGTNYCSTPNTGYYITGIYSSDIRLKENITDYNSSLAEIMKLKPYNYTYKSDEKKTPQVGVIAQDLQKVFPNAVKQGKDGFLTIRWDEMFFAMVNAIKELNQKIETMIAQVTNINKDAKDIKQQQKDIKKQVAQLNSRAAKLERK